MSMELGFKCKDFVVVKGNWYFLWRVCEFLVGNEVFDGGNYCECLDFFVVWIVMVVFFFMNCEKILVSGCEGLYWRISGVFIDFVYFGLIVYISNFEDVSVFLRLLLFV